MTELSTSSWTSMLSEDSYYGQYNTSENPSGIVCENFETFVHFLYRAGLTIVLSLLFLILIAIFGLIGNGIVIWFLSFVIKRNPITTYILNLALADSGVLITFWGAFYLLCIEADMNSPVSYCIDLFVVFYICSVHLLTIISTEKCLSVTFPIWYRCHRPKHLSAVVCILIWSMGGINICLFSTSILMLIVFIANIVICIPLTTVSTLTLLVKLRCRFHQRQQGRLYIVILLTLLVFLIFGAPLHFIPILYYFNPPHDIANANLISLMGTCINSSINPLIYFLVGRKKTRRSRESIKAVLQRVFSDKPDYRT